MYASDITSFLGHQHLLCTESRPPSAMTHIFSLQDFQSELTHLEKLVTMLPDSPVVASVITTFSHKLQGVKTWSSESIVTLLLQAQALNIPEEHKGKILHTIQNLQAGANSHMKLCNSGQMVDHLPSYFTQSEWAKLANHVSTDDKFRLISQRLHMMGMFSLKENTKCQAIAIILMINSHGGKPAPTPHAVHAMVDDFQSIFHGEPKPSSHGAGHARYPSNPMELGKEWLSKAYPSEQPLCQEVALAAWVKKVHGYGS